MRYYCDLSEQDTAATLGIPVGTVKSSCARALARLRVEAASAAGGGRS
jgi:DNA-directed RNA polymerase specialized sigma24 family protein